MNRRRSLLLLLLLLVLVVVYQLNIQKLSPRSESSRTDFVSRPGPVLKLSPGEKVVQIDVIDPLKGTELQFTSVKAGEWHMVRPVDYPAESVLVDGLVALLKLSTRIREMTSAGVTLSDFQFDRPILKVCVGTNLSSQKRCLIIGSKAVAAESYYAKWMDESVYFMVDQKFISACDKSAYALRKKQLFELLESGVRSIAYRGKFSREIRRTGKRWFLLAPKRSALPREQANELLVGLNNLYVKEFLDEKSASDSELGLETNSEMLMVRSGKEQDRSLTVGAEVPGRAAYYAKTNQEPTILLISSAKWNKIREAFEHLD